MIPKSVSQHCANQRTHTLMKTIVKQNPDDENSLFFTQSDRSYVM